MKIIIVLLAFVAVIWQPAAAQPSPGSDTVWTKVIGPPWVVNEVRFSPDGSLIYAGATNKKPFALRASDGELAREFEGIPSVRSIDLSKDGKLFAAGEDSNKVFIFNTDDGLIKYVLEIPDSIRNKFNSSYHIGCNSLSISNDNKYIAGTFFGTGFGKEDNKRCVLIWDLDTGSFVKVIWDNWIEDVRFSPTEPVMAVSHSKFEESLGIDLYSATDWGKIKTLKSEQQQTEDMEFSKDGRFLASISSERSVDIWDMVTKSMYERLTEIASMDWSVCLVNNNTVLVGGYEDSRNKVQIWDIIKKSKIKSITVLSPRDLSLHNNLVAVADAYNITLLNIDNYVGISDGHVVEIPPQVNPNPVTSSSEIKIFLKLSGITCVKIINNSGIEIEEIFNGFLESGIHSIPWNPKNLANGVYYCRIVTNNTESTIKIILER